MLPNLVSVCQPFPSVHGQTHDRQIQCSDETFCHPSLGPKESCRPHLVGNVRSRLSCESLNPSKKWGRRSLYWQLSHTYLDDDHRLDTIQELFLQMILIVLLGHQVLLLMVRCRQVDESLPLLNASTAIAFANWLVVRSQAVRH